MSSAPWVATSVFPNRTGGRDQTVESEEGKEADVKKQMALGVVVVGVAGVAAAVAAAVSPGVEVKLFQFKPTRIEAKPGAEVQWTNRDDITHTVTPGKPGAPQSAFRLVLEGRGATGSATFAGPGDYPYFCERHPDMRGEIHIEP
jgi:plastocyanin